MMTAPLDLAGMARLILSAECRSIVMLTGAGVSVAADIPDFRSPGGFYDTLRAELITATDRERAWMQMDPTYVVSWDIFRENQFPYLEVRRPFILGIQAQQWKATISHRFAELLHAKTGKLTRLYTQNIDGLDFQCSTPPEKIVAVHGSIATVSCEGCGAPMDRISRTFNNQDSSSPPTSTNIVCPNCKKPLVKPNTVLFGRQLPSRFFECIELDMASVDLLIVAGTSLVVSPANQLVRMVPNTAVRMIVNRERVGEDLGINYDSNQHSRDYFAQGNCDDIFFELLQHLGWTEDLDIDLLPPQSKALIQAKGEK